MERHLSFNTRIDLPFEQVVRLLRDRPQAVLGAAQDAVAVPGGSLVHVAMPMPAQPHELDIAIGELKVIDPHCVMLPMRWGAADGAAWFPHIEGEVEVSDLDHTTPMTQVSFIGRYRPRYGVVGTIIDAAGTHVLAERTVEQFLVAVCDHIMELATADA